MIMIQNFSHSPTTPQAGMSGSGLLLFGQMLASLGLEGGGPTRFGVH